MKNECYWDYPLTGKDGKIEKRSRIYRDYYLDHNGELTCKQVAQHFGIKEQTIKEHKSRYDWDTVLNDKRAFESQQKRVQRLNIYNDFIEKDLKKSSNRLNAKYALEMMSAIKLGLAENDGSYNIPDALTEEVAIDILLKVNPDTVHKQILRNLEQPGTIKDTQTIEGTIRTTGELNLTLLEKEKKAKEYFQELEKDFK